MKLIGHNNTNLFLETDNNKNGGKLYENMTKLK